MKIQYPSINPKCDGELRVTETDHQKIFEVEGESFITPWRATKNAACCTKCRKRWTREHLDA